jgi:hypothetical protein
MDQNREIRFLIPPFFLFASLLWGAYLDPCIDLAALLKPDSVDILGVIAAGSVLVIPLGFLIGSISVTILRIIFLSWKHQSYEADLSEDCLERIWSKLNTDQARDRKLTLYAAATFDHELLSTGIHEWLMRRWNSFNVSVHSCIALLLSHGMGCLFSINQDCRWWLTTLVLGSILLYTGVMAWRETMGMADFQSHRVLDNWTLAIFSEGVG